MTLRLRATTAPKKGVVVGISGSFAVRRYHPIRATRSQKILTPARNFL